MDTPRAWRRLPLTSGPHWFARGLEARSAAECVEVYGHGEDRVILRRWGLHVITPKDGWWLAVLDDRGSAPVSE